MSLILFSFTIICWLKTDCFNLNNQTIDWTKINNLLNEYENNIQTKYWNYESLFNWYKYENQIHISPGGNITNY